MISNSFHMSIRSGHRASAPSLSSSVTPSDGQGKRRRRRGKRGGKKRKHRAGVRRNQLKSERLAKSHLRVMYWNCRSLEQRGVVAEKLAYSCDILCLQETKLGQRKTFKVYGYQEPIYNRLGHGQVILVADGIKYSSLDLQRWSSDNLHLVGVEIYNQPLRYIVNVYACNNSMLQEDWLVLDDMQEALPGKMLICGDFNARGSEWGNTITNPQGIALEDALDSCNLICLNDGSVTRLAQREGDSDSAIDLALVTPSIVPSSSWFAMGSLGSDHLPCGVHVRRHSERQARKAPRVFSYDIKSEDPVSRLRKKARPPPQQKRRVTQPPWWNNELESLWVAKRKSLKAFQRHPGDETAKKLAKSAANAFKEEAEKAKSQKYEAFCEEVSADKALIKFWNLYGAMHNKAKSRVIPDFADENGVMLHSDSEKGEALFERFIRQTDQKNEAERSTFLSTIREYLEDEPQFAIVSSESVEAQIKASDDSAPGPDGVRYSHLKNLSEEAINDLTEVLQDSFSRGDVPEDWLHSHLSPVPKPEKDPTKISSYRIITMQNTVGKLLEKIVARKLSIELEQKGLLPPTLGSYRQGKDTWANAAVLASDVYDGFERGDETLVAALDLEDAYNRVSYKILMTTLMNMKVNPVLIVWIGSTMLKRKVALRVGSWISEVKEITPGLPQGSALSPVLFNVYTVGVTSNQLEGPGRTLSFADDVLTYRQGRDRQDIASGLQEELDRLQNWCDDNNGKLHPDKANVLWCSLNNRAVKDVMPEVSIGGKVIKRDHSLRYLGIVFDRSLSGKDHISSCIKGSQRS